MSHFAQIENNITTLVLVVDDNDILDEKGSVSEALGIQFCIDQLGGNWVGTSHNLDGMYNFAGTGDTYDSTSGVFSDSTRYT